MTATSPPLPLGCAESLLSASGLAAGYDDIPVVRNLDLAVAPGKILAVLGANGAGKTTTLRALSGMIKPTAGVVRFRDSDVTRAKAHELVALGLAHVPEDRGIFFGLTVAEHFRLRGCDPDDGYAHFPVLRPLANRAAGLLSGGEQQMLALGCALTRLPTVLLIDELSLGLAPVIVERLLPVIRRYAIDAGAAVVLVEQHVHLALQIADDALVLRHGEVVLTGSASNLMSDPNLVTASYLGPHPEQSTDDP